MLFTHYIVVMGYPDLAVGHHPFGRVLHVCKSTPQDGLIPWIGKVFCVYINFQTFHGVSFLLVMGFPKSHLAN